jgi:hypothetical protein
VSREAPEALLSDTQLLHHLGLNLTPLTRFESLQDNTPSAAAVGCAAAEALQWPDNCQVALQALPLLMSALQW